MFRRARINVRPNVRPAGRATGGAADAGPQGSDSQAVTRAEAAAEAASVPQSAAPLAESNDKASSSNDAGEASKPAEMPTQRRKRISTVPNLVKPRSGPSSAQHSASKPQRRASQAPDGSTSLQKDSSPSDKSNVESPLKSPTLPEKKTPVPQVPQFSPLKKSVNKEQTVGVPVQKSDDTLQKNVPSPLKERPTQERSGTQEEKLSMKPSPVKEKQLCSDRERILKARKLREMLKEELKKERMLKQRPPIIEGRSPPDRSKMTMRDLIYYLPENNPMKSSLAEDKRTEKNSTLSQLKEQEEKSTPDNDEEDEEEEAENEEESQDGPLLVPRVKVAEDGSIILDEESLTVEVLRTKGPCVVEENDPIFERGSTTTYSSFRKSFYTKPWSNKETDMFFLAISMVGTDFSLIGRLFPHRARAEIKNKFKREEKANGWRIDKAFKEKRPFDFEFFAQLLEKVLADEGRRKQKTVKSQKPKEKKPSQPRKKPNAKATSTEAANNQDDLQEARIFGAETEADAVTAEKENEESLGVSEQAEEQVAFEPVLAKKKRKKKRKDDLEQEVENFTEEMSVTSKTAEKGKSSKKKKKLMCDANNDGHTSHREEQDGITEGKQDETVVTGEEKSESCVLVDDIMEGESDVNLCSFEDSDDVILETESAKLRILDVRDAVSQERQISELRVSKVRSEERQSEETRETKGKDIHDLHRPDEKQSASESDSQSEMMQTEKPSDRECLQRPKPSLVRSSGRREATTQEKMIAETSSPSCVNSDEKCSDDDSRRNRREDAETEDVDLDTKSEEPGKTVIANTLVRGCRQRFKPNVTRASGRKEELEKDTGNDGMSHSQPKRETEKNTDQSNKCATSEEAAEEDDKALETMSQSNETAGFEENSKQSVLKPTPLNRGRLQRPKPNLGRTVARQKDLTDEKHPEAEKTKGGKLGKGVITYKGENSDLCLKNDVVVHEDAQPHSLMLEGNVSTDSELNSVPRRQCSQGKSSEAESYESEKELSGALKQLSEFNTGESDPQKEKEKTVVSSSRLLRSRFQRPKPNLRPTSRKDVLDINNKLSQKDTSKDESLTQCGSECNILPDINKAEKYKVLQPLESSGKQKSFDSQEDSERPNFKSPETFSRSEDDELKFCLPNIKQDDGSTANAGKNNAEEESKERSLQPVQLARSRFQRYKPNLGRAVGKKESQILGNEREKKPEVKQLVLQKDELANTVIGENEAVFCQSDVLSREEQEQQEVPPATCISENILCEQSSDRKSASQEGKLSAVKPGQFIRNRSLRITPNLARVYSEKKSLFAQKGAVLVEEEANEGEHLPVAKESEEPHSLKVMYFLLILWVFFLKSKDDVEVLFLGHLAKNDNLDINAKSMRSETLCSSTKLPNCHRKGEEQEHLSTDAIGSIQATIERSSDKLHSGEESKHSDKKPLRQVREPQWNPRPDLMRVARKRSYPEEGENGEEDDAESRNAEDSVMLEKTGVSMHNTSYVVEAASFSETARKHNFTCSEETSCKRIEQDSRLQPSEIPSESENQVEQEDNPEPSASQEKYSDNLTRRQSRRSSKRVALPKHVSDLQTAASSASECGTDCCEKGTQRQEVKLSVTRRKSYKTTHRKKSGKEHRSSKITLVTLWASQEEEEEEDTDDFEPDEENECFAPEEVNKAPVFVPIGLRSPKPVPVQIEATMEELEISVNIPDVQVSTDVESLYHASVPPVVQREEKETTVHENPEVDKGVNDGSTEAAMTLLAMGDPMFQLKTSTEEWAHMLPAQDELDMTNSLGTYAYSEQNKTPSQYLLSEVTSTKELVSSEGGSNVNMEDQSTNTRIGVEEYFEKNPIDTSDSSSPTVNSMRLTGDRHLRPETTFGGLKSNQNIIQKSLSANILVKQLEQVQSESTSLGCTAETQKVELEQVRPTPGSSSILHDFDTRSMELTKHAEKIERTEDMTYACGSSGDLRPVTAPPKPEEFHLGLQDCPNQSSVDGIPEQNSCPPEHYICPINFTQNEACAQDAQQCISTREETSAVNDDHKCPEEEQTFILTLVEIPADSKEFDASTLLEHTSEPLLPAPILISPINASETSMTEGESIGSLRTAVDQFAAPLNSSMENKQSESASVEPVLNLQTTRKRTAAEPEENDFPPSKKTLSAVVVEGNLETTSKACSVKSTNAPIIASGNPFQITEPSAKEKVPSSVLVSMLPLAERSQLETLENLEDALLENSASKQEGMSKLTSNRKAEISEQGKREDGHEYGQSEHTGSLAPPSKTPLLRTGRKPMGFLSLICKKSSSESAEDTKGSRVRIQKPRIVAPKRNLKKPTLATKDDGESYSLPSTSTSPSVECENVSTDAAVTVPSNKMPEKPPLCGKDQEKEEEPTRISEYFFSDIFMEVDDSE
ncbi:transcription factor TFIIIB component B'' homolog isoform X2 [Colius striatus]|uniref:transcription factor TFIIIB component B'' homolog isoform X2 n=1 Tax=Colius striatus TaxID=57412 RepID=UPI002B1E67F7|nr:transcription factor TFIIIB component B'' homolog isoform X2 [Colius striatus]